MEQFNLQERLLDFSELCIDISESLPRSQTGSHLSGQLIRSGTSVSLNYGEACSAESRKDFVHKLKIILKELRETQVCLRLIEKRALYKNLQRLDSVIKESDELICIFVKSVQTTLKNNCS